MLLSSSTLLFSGHSVPHLGAAGPQLTGTLAMLSTDGTGAGEAPHTGHTTGLSSQPTRMATIRVALTLIRTLPTCLAKTGRSGEQLVLANVQGIQQDALHRHRPESTGPCLLAAQPPDLASSRRLGIRMLDSAATL